MAINPFSLVTLSEVKEHFSIDPLVTESDSVLEAMIDRASLFVESHTGRQWIARDYVEFQDGTRGDTLLLSHFPVNSVTELVTSDGNGVFSSGNVIPPSDFVLEQSSVIRLVSSRLFPRGTQNVKVSYRAGYQRTDSLGSDPEMPADVRFATVLMVEFYYQQKNDRALNISSKSRNQQTAKIIHDVPLEVIRLLENHVRFECPALNLPVTNA